MHRHDAGLSRFSIVMLAILMAFSFSITGCEKAPKFSSTATKKTKKVPPPGHRPNINVGGAAPAPDAAESAAEAPPAVSTVANIEGGLPNGLFPQMSLSFKQNGFGGGLVPDFRNPFADDSADSNQVSALTSEEVDEFVDDVVGDQSAPQELMTASARAFIERRDSDAFKYLYCQILSDDETASKYPLKWFSGISQPKVAIRFGVGVTYTPPKDFSGKPPVIGDPEDVSLPGANSRSNPRGGSGRGSGIGAGGGAPGGGGSTGTAASPYANVDTSNPEGFLLYFTGDFGDRLLTQLESRRLNNDAFYGMALKDIGVDYAVQQVSATSPTAAPSQPPSGRGRGIGTAGGGAAPVGDGGGGVIGAGGGAAANATGPRTERLDRVRGSSAAADPDSELSGSLSPGVMLVGEGKKEVLVDRAREMGLDVLLLFNVRVSSSRTPTSTAGLKVINLHSDDAELLYSSRSLKSDVVAKNREAGVTEDSDPVAKALNMAFEELDEKIQAQPLPENLKPEHVAGRITQLMSKSHPDPLSVAIEVVGFHRMELLDAELAEKALDQVLGEGKGSVLLTGTSEERKATLAEYMPNGDSD